MQNSDEISLQAVGKNPVNGTASDEHGNSSEE
jgi:hypothetical protein